MNLSNQEIQDRRPVWVALSDLFLDTELQEHDFAFIARVMAGSPYSLAEIECILYNEVYPVCIPNLHCVAGVWDGFSDEWLEESICENVIGTKRTGRLFQLSRWMIRNDWNRVREIYTRSE